MKELAHATRAYREALLKDKHRPLYHFAFPDDNGYPGDPNGAPSLTFNCRCTMNRVLWGIRQPDGSVKHV